MPPGFETFLHTLADGFHALPDKPEEDAAATLRALWHLSAGTALSVQTAAETALPDLDEAGRQRLRALIAQRKTGVPLAHLTGRQRFMGLELLAGPQALIPRIETELLARTALQWLQQRSGRLVLDICTGSGNLALAIAHHAPNARVAAADLSADAVELARRNAVQLGLQSRVEWHTGDLLAPFDTPQFHGAVDLVVCNPPYISSPRLPQMPGEISGHEPALAFDGGPLGIRILQRLIREAPRFLQIGGALAFEVGLGQGDAVVKRMQALGGFSQVRGVSDAHGDVRCIVGVR
jgi:release factor glutamine methyltransferase